MAGWHRREGTATREPPPYNRPQSLLHGLCVTGRRCPYDWCCLDSLLCGLSPLCEDGKGYKAPNDAPFAGSHLITASSRPRTQSFSLKALTPFGQQRKQLLNNDHGASHASSSRDGDALPLLHLGTEPRRVVPYGRRPGYPRQRSRRLEPGAAHPSASLLSGEAVRCPKPSEAAHPAPEPAPWAGRSDAAPKQSDPPFHSINATC